MERRAANRKVRKSIAIIGEGLTEYRYVDVYRRRFMKASCRYSA